MNELKQVFKTFTKGEWIGTILFILMLTVTQIVSGSTGLAFVAGLLGGIYVVFVRKGSRLCYIFGGVQIALYIYISLSSRFYGDVMLNSFNLVMQPIGWYLWTKRDNNGIVKPKSLTKRNMTLIFIIWAVAIGFYGMWLRTLGGNTPLIDAVTTCSSITAMLLSIQAYKEQWKFWLICNATSIVMWSLASTRGDNAAFPMICLWVAYFINGVVAYREWYKK